MKNFMQKGQSTIAIVVITALLTNSGSWIMNKIFNSPDQLQAQINTTASKVEVQASQIKTLTTTMAELQKDNKSLLVGMGILLNDRGYKADAEKLIGTIITP